MNSILKGLILECTLNWAAFQNLSLNVPLVSDETLIDKLQKRGKTFVNATLQPGEAADYVVFFFFFKY